MNESARGPIDQTAHRDIGRKGQEGRGRQCFPRIYPSKNKKLINNVDRQGNQEHVADRAPTAFQMFFTASTLCQKRPTIGRAVFSGVSDPVSRRENCRHERLKREAKRQGTGYAVRKVAEKAIENAVHGALPARGLEADVSDARSSIRKLLRAGGARSNSCRGDDECPHRLKAMQTFVTAKPYL